MLHYHFIPRNKVKKNPFRANQCGTSTIKDLMIRFASGATTEQEQQNDCFDLPDFMMPQNLDLVDVAAFKESNKRAYQAFVNAVRERKNAAATKPVDTSTVSPSVETNTENNQ